MKLYEILRKMLDEGASDLHFKVGSPPMLRIDGKLVPINDKNLAPEHTFTIAKQFMSEEQFQKFENEKELDFSVGIRGMGRFRINCFIARGAVAIALRKISVDIKNIDELNLPEKLKSLSLSPRGLILVTGTTGSGKSTTLASMIDYVNSIERKHVITIEDPIEFLFKDKKSIINQREVGADTESFSQALRRILRQDPDVIMIGEMRDKETIGTAITAADTGHLVMSTLHTTNAVQTINRIIGYYPPHQQEQIRIQLASTLKAVISLRLIKKASGVGRVPAVELLINTPHVQDMIKDKKETYKIHSAIKKGDQYGMQTFDQSIMALYQNGLITLEEALKQSSNPDDFKLKVQGIDSSDMSDMWEEE
ncbi:MAG: PilT/PilU family type 4a pilus ATPase [Candidatus Mcinerneyibacterium aminivorans]|uniref:PilT/PilU family type 4a pilus ATPase n=1 Tax=Candidatus Mcinerneyibacterium aminivorans TaxID=2703815 RepID=A0A5D0MI20_9BACT|nr:MAG: PilT/PilU family type 4a pilus ATPase [Candidatus Mcinerneyibacterium aminivorans]